jgi:hypothetical protein
LNVCEQSRELLKLRNKTKPKEPFTHPEIIAFSETNK